MHGKSKQVVIVESKHGGAAPARVQPRIIAAPAIRQVYWCDFWRDARLPEMWKTRPALIVSYQNSLYGPCAVVPISTDSQDGKAAKWAHKLQGGLEGRDAWVVCNHLYTICPSRLSPFKSPIPRLNEDEFHEILAIVLKWLPKLPEPKSAMKS